MPWENGKKEIVRHVNELVAQLKNKTYQSPFRQGFAEVYVEDPKSAGSGEPVSEAIPVPRGPADQKRERFIEMRRLAWTSRPAGALSGSRDRFQTVLFYKQAKLMEHFEDDYEGNAPFSMYFPYYQRMGYEQLRTYFTWRSGVRGGIVRRTAFSYVFLYLYELINNIGVQNCEDGLSKLAFLWQEYRGYEKKLDRYMNEWIKDYYITNEFSEPFEALLQKTGNLQELYRPSGAGSFFDFYYPYSDYKIKKSIFYTPETAKTIRACFDCVVKALDEFMRGQGGEFEDLIFYSKSSSWTPFSNALYCSFSRRNKNRFVKISDTERYRCENGRWTSSKNKIPKENGRLLIGYLLKRIEQFYRGKRHFKYRVTANPKKIDAAELARQIGDPRDLFARIDAAVAAYDRRSRRRIVTVDAGRIETIRENAQKIQERLSADEEEAEPDPPAGSPEPEIRRPAPAEPPSGPAAGAADAWGAFARSLSRTELTAVRMILRSAPARDLHAFSKENGTMPEVLVDGINQKALDAVGDNIMELSDQITIFDEYKDDLKRVISIECQ